MTAGRHLLVGLLLALSLGTSHARDADLLELPRMQFLAQGASVPATADIKKAIVAGASRRGWVLRTEAPEKLTLAYTKGSKHEVVIDVLFDAMSFQIVYGSSMNMNYRQDGTRAQIHGNYNRWVVNLNGDIREELMRLR